MYKFLLLFLLIITTSAYAAKDTDKLFDLSLNELMNITVVSASKKNESILQSPSAIEILTREELELLKCNKLSECLEFTTGISSVVGEGNIFATTTIRGNTLANYNTNTLLLVDGIPILNAYHGSFNLDSIPLSAISRIEIVKGAASVLYGSNAINGVINIITLNDKDKGMVRTRYGSYQTLLTSTSLNYDLGKDFSLGLFAEHSSSSGEPLTIKDALTPQNVLEFSKPYKNNSLIAKLKYKDFWMQTQFSRQISSSYKTRGFVTDTGEDLKEDNDESEYLIALGYKQEINNDIFLKFQTAYHEWKMKKDKLEGSSIWDYDSSSIYNELEAHFYTNGDSSNVLGVSYEIANAHRYKSENQAYDIGLNNEKTTNISLYDNGNYTLSDRLNFLYGARYFYSSYYDKTQNKTINNDNLSTRAGLIYKVKNKMALKALFAQAYRVPTYFEKEVDTAGKIKGNPNLTPELSNSYDLIFIHELDYFNYSLGIFYTQIEDKIARVYLDATLQQNQNVGDVSYYGLEVNTKFRFSKSFWGFANYSYTDSGSTSDESMTKFTYNHMLNLAVSKLFYEEYLINTNLKYLDNWGEASSYTLLNFSFEYKPKTMKSISYEMVMKNILNQKIDLPEIAKDDPNVPTTPSMYESRIYLGLKYDF